MEYVEFNALDKLKELEKRLNLVESKLNISNKSTSAESTIPDGWVTTDYFETNWGFLASSHLTSLFKEETNHFAGNYLKKGKLFYVDPLVVMRYVINRNAKRGSRFKTNVRFALGSNDGFRELYFKAVKELPKDFGEIE